MNLFKRFLKLETETSKKTNDEKENNSIEETSEYMLASVQKKEIENNCYVESLSNLVNINKEFDEYFNAFRQKGNNDELYQINKFINANEIIDFFNNPKNKSKAKKLKKLGFNPATIMITISLCEIEKDINDIKEVCKSIMNFLENDKQSEIEGDIKTLNRVIVDYKYNWDDEKYINSYYNQVLDIKRTANKNINFYQKQINKDIKKTSFIMTTNKSINENQNELEKNFSYYRLCLYIYCFASFMEVMLLENFQKEYLLSKKEELELLSKEYTNNYEKACLFLKKEANKSVQGNILSGIGNAGKAIGDFAEKVQVIKDKNIDTWFNRNGDNLKVKGQEMKDKFLFKFETIKNPQTDVFINKIDLISKIYNDTQNIYFDKEKIYLEMVK